MSKYKKVELTPRKVAEIKRDAATQMMIMLAAYLMDYEGFDDKQIVDAWQGVTRYAEAVNDKLISLNKVCKIINENTGLDIRWY